MTAAANYTPEQLADFPQHQFAELEIELADQVLYLTLNRPEKRNALGPVLMKELAYALLYAKHAPSIWAVVLRANGSIWCAGADLKAFAGADTGTTASSIPTPLGEVLLGELVATVHKPVICQVHANVYAGGHLLIGPATHVVAAAGVTFSLPEVKRGLWPFQVMAVLGQTMPPRKVLDWCIRGNTISAEEAQAWGLVTEVVSPENLARTVQELVTEITRNSPTAIRTGLAAWTALQALPAERQQAFLKQELNALLASEDAQEGLAAFKEKRTPNWSGR